LAPRMIGMNGELSTAPLLLEAGKKFTIYIAGDGVDQILAEGISVSSPSIQIVPDSLRPIEFGTAYPVISFEVVLAPNIRAGDYSIRMQSVSGELAYLPGALTIEPD